MKQTINFSQFCDAFANVSRSGQFTYQAKKILFDYLELYEEETGEEQKEKIEEFLQNRASFCGWTNQDCAVFAQF